MLTDLFNVYTKCVSTYRESLRLAYQSQLSLDEKQKKCKADKMDTRKADQMQRLGMGWSGKRLGL